MNKKDKVALVPKLRFKEYDSAKPWRVISLIDTVDENVKWSFTGGPFGSNLKSSDYKNEGIRVIQLQNIGDAQFVNNYKIFTSKEKADELISCNIYSNEIIMSKMGDPVGRACIIPNFHSRYLMCSDGIRLVIAEKYYSKYFIYSLINSEVFRSTIESHSTGSTRKRIGLEVLKNLQMAVPEKEEQQKIADCLSFLDDLITAEDKKLKALKAHKKGLMQKLFPSEGATVPEWRFPEFRGSVEWERKTIGRSCVSFSGGTPDTSNKAYYNGNIPFIRSGEINKNTTELFLTQEGFYNSATKMVRVGDVLVALYGANSGEVSLSKIEGAINQAILCLQHETNNAFVYQYLSHKKNWIITTYIQGGQGNLSGEIVKSIELYIPKQEEQQKIAACLSSLDDRITTQTDKIEALQAHKKGLMQGLFPSIEEVGE